MKGVISAGHELTARAGAEMLLKGGNAFDAAVSAAFASFVCEPTLTSLAGGGFMMTRQESGEALLYDFFTSVPGRGGDGNGEVNFYGLDVDFGDATQEFHVGEGSAAVPGNMAGLNAVYEDLCTLPLADILEPAIRYARDGITVNPRQAFFIRILEPIVTLSEDSASIFAPGGKLITEGGTIYNRQVADTLEHLLGEGLTAFYEGDVAGSIIEGFGAKGFITPEDLATYTVCRREPLHITYRERDIYTNPPPSSGGALIAFSLKLLEGFDVGSLGHNSASYLRLLKEVKKVTNEARRESLDRLLHEGGTAGDFLSERNVDLFRARIGANTAGAGDTPSPSCTTQISVMDSSGNAASITTSTGSGSGYMIPGTGIMMNNMLGEEDLNPMGFHAQEPGTRMSSMMSPTIAVRGSTPEIVTGSGGSNRIRSAILQAIINSIDFKLPVFDAVNSPRAYYDGEGTLHLEKGFDEAVMDEIEREVKKLNRWSEKHVFFGGAHTVLRTGEGDGAAADGYNGAGDERRGGVALICSGGKIERLNIKGK